MTNSAVGEQSRESLDRGYSIAIKGIFSFVEAPQNLTNNWGPHFFVHGHQLLDSRNLITLKTVIRQNSEIKVSRNISIPNSRN